MCKIMCKYLYMLFLVSMSKKGQRRCHGSTLLDANWIRYKTLKRVGETIVGKLATREFALYFDGYEGVLNTQHLWMGSAMIVDEPTYSSSLETAQYVSTTSIPAGGENLKMDIFRIVPELNAMADVGEDIGGSRTAKYLCPKKRILIRSLQKAVKHIYTALEVVLLDIRKIRTISDGSSPPAAVQSLSTKTIASSVRLSSPVGMPGGYPESETLHKKDASRIPRE
ncbi:uncharacterized protein F5147DRAFT_659330 [Suillus discolor]|uniref:Uncharacterized protein n=1 Tax=Suillus discolor TaxID=1912936 RepID=A0A9P7ESF6_9AGAM|nr:uncharacterized protein F5147DRAFT_659330 [Suillus discolor]KAG2086013.1 hypothetical protein F5147DRAFT_659330 [Suillus discolor]